MCEIKHQGITTDRSVHSFLQQLHSDDGEASGIHCLFNLDISVQSYFYFNFDICTTLYFHPLRQLSVKIPPFSYLYFNSSQESLLSLKIMYISDKSGTDHFLKRSKAYRVNFYFSSKVKFYDFLSLFHIFGHITGTNFISWM